MSNNWNKKILVAMSGGVDSSAAVLMLKAQGWECVGVMMDLHGDTDTSDARRVAEKLDIEFHVVDFKKEFKEIIIDKFADDYKRGLTPNPCVDCNREIKFGLLWEKAKELGCCKMATGHYARISQEDGQPVLRKAACESKDQSYFLHVIPKELLGRIIFPLGDFSNKDETRKIARDAGLDIASKGDSQDICFVPDGDYVRVIREQCLYANGFYKAESDEAQDDQVSQENAASKEENSALFNGLKEGDFVNEDGETLGRHKGIICYTIGQRKGLGIASSNGPLYVLDKDPSANTVVLGSNDALFKTKAEATGVNWLIWDDEILQYASAKTEREILKDHAEKQIAIRCSARIRYRHKEQPCTVYLNKMDAGESHVKTIQASEPHLKELQPGESHVKNKGAIVTSLKFAHNVKVLFDEPQRAVTPGQAIVFYDEDRVLGGGTIEK